MAFMFASTNLVIELGILIFIFLGWQFVAAEIVGGLVMIVISATLIRGSCPEAWLEAARERVEEASPGEEEDFDWKARIRSPSGWRRVGHNFVSEWKMVWEEILIGFTVAGFVAVLVPASWWGTIFLLEMQGELPGWLIVLENALVAPFVAAATFIGSMGNIPLATVLNANGVLFAGIMGFIYSDLIVPPLVAVNAKYYGWRVALYIAGVMYVSMVSTALLLHVGFGALGITPEREACGGVHRRGGGGARRRGLAHGHGWIDRDGRRRSPRGRRCRQNGTIDAGLYLCVGTGLRISAVGGAQAGPGATRSVTSPDGAYHDLP